MSLACLTMETALQDLLQQYNEHQTRLSGWIAELSERASELLSDNVVEIESDTSGQTKQLASADCKSPRGACSRPPCNSLKSNFKRRFA